MNPNILNTLTPKLLADYGFNQSSDGQWLNQGRCPECGKKSLFTHASNPWVLKCGRENKCGVELDIKQLYPELFDNLNKKYPATAKNPNETADMYMNLIRGFDIKQVSGMYTQENYYHPHGNKGTATVRFNIADGVYMERFVEPVTITDPETGEKEERKANFKGAHRGLWWAPPNMPINEGDTVWLTEGCLDAIALRMVGIKAVAVLSCVNFPEKELLKYKGKDVNWVWALDNDKAGKSYTRKHVKRTRELGFKSVSAAQAPNKDKRDWNDLFLAKKLNDSDITEYRHQGDLLIARSAFHKAMIIYRHTKRHNFVFDYANRLYAFNFDLDKYNKVYEAIENSPDGVKLNEQSIKEKALEQAGNVIEIANCHSQFLYFQANKITDESWYFLRVDLPNGGGSIKNTFTGSQIASPAEFKKRLLSIAPGSSFKGKSQHLDYLIEKEATGIKTVDTIDFIGYSKEHRTYIFPDVAFKDGHAYEANADEYFELPKGQAVKSLYKAKDMHIEKNARHYKPEWVEYLWGAFGVKGMTALTFWFGSLFAEQIREKQSSFPFLEIVGEASAGKTTLIEFLWRLFGQDREGIDPNKGTRAGLDRTLAQFANMPTVFIEADREEHSHSKHYDWEEMKPYYNGRGMRVRGMKNSGNETYEPPFRGTIVVTQNNPVDASDAVMQRIVHIPFKAQDKTHISKQNASALKTLSIEELSYFIRLAVAREKQVVEHVVKNVDTCQSVIMKQKDVTEERLGKNHAQLVCMFEQLAELIGLDDERKKQTAHYIMGLACERQKAIGADHPMVAEFWETYHYLVNIMGDETRVNHSPKPAEFISINLNHFVEMAANNKQQLPLMRDLKRLLKASKTYPYVTQQVVQSRAYGGETSATKSVRVWTFKKSASA